MNLRLIIFLVVALAQLAVPGSAVWSRQQTLRHGRVWKFRTVPVDPVDVIRGRYVALRFAAEEIPTGREEPGPEKIKPGSAVYVTLKEGADGFAEVDQISITPRKGDNVVKAEAWYWRDHSDHVRFPFDKYWVTEKVAPEAERVYREKSREKKRSAYVTVRVRDGDAALDQLYIDDQPLADYLRTHSAR